MKYLKVDRVVLVHIEMTLEELRSLVNVSARGLGTKGIAPNPDEQDAVKNLRVILDRADYDAQGD